MSDQIPGAATAAMKLATDLDKRLTTHEAVCAYRYETLLRRMGRVEGIMITVAGAVLVGMAKLIFWP